ncbi:MAG TPA: archease [Anaeromyxobacteraceae bacterium]|nr:archease [Anaeromyxobacteraceae bacterium]
MATVRYALPQPYRDIDHTADVGVEVEGASSGEALARLVLAEAALLAGGGPVKAERTARFEVAGPDLCIAAIGPLRELLYRFATERVIAASCTVGPREQGGLEVLVEFRPFDPVAHAEGWDLKAVTLHRARFEEEGGLFRAQAIFDV